MKLRRDFRSSQVIKADVQKFYSKPLTRVSFELVVSVVIVIVFALLALRPTLLTMSELLRDIQEKKVLDEQLGDKISSLATAQSEYLLYQPQIVALDRAIMRNSSLEEVAYYLESLLGESGLGIQRLSFGPLPVLTQFESTPRSKFVLTQYQMQISVEGELAQLQKFFARIESVKPLFSINGWTVSPGIGDDSPPVEAVINLGVYIYANQDALDAAQSQGVAPASSVQKPQGSAK